MTKTCTIKGCTKTHYGRGWCQAHYRLWKRNGDPLKRNIERDTTRQRTIEEKFNARIKKKGGHWLWTGDVDGKGYGVLNHVVDGVNKRFRAHRVSYELFVGPIPDGYNVNHRNHCHTPLCVRPDHLYAGTQSQNMKDRVVLSNGKFPFQ